jgi:hypothetical protein
MEWHMQQGLAVTWVEGEQELQKRGLKSIPPSVLNTCKQSKKSQKSRISSYKSYKNIF